MLRRVLFMGMVLGSMSHGVAAAEEKAASCADLVDAASCADRATSNDGNSHAWKVQKAGGYTLTVTPTGKSETLRLWPAVTLTDAKGKSLGETKSSGGGPATLTLCVAPGAHTIAVKDVDATHIGKMKGGAGYTLDIKPSPDAACAGGCSDLADASSCSDRASSDAGQSHAWKVTMPGAYSVTVTAKGKSETMRLWPRLSVLDAKGKELAHASAEGSAPSVTVTVCAEKGAHQIQVKDVDAKHIGQLKGGAGYAIDVKAADASKCANKK